MNITPKPHQHQPNLAQCLHTLARERPDAIALIAVDENGDTLYDYAELDRRARCIAVYLTAHAAAHGAAGERALLLMDSGIDYVSAFFGCLYAGVVAVPVYPPESKREPHLARLRGIAQDAGVRYVLTTAALRQRFAGQYGELAPDAAVVPVDTLCAESMGGDGFLLHSIDPSDIAFLQYTSGSTGTPKGVMVSQGNLLANEIAIKAALGVGPDDVFVSWLPLYHDMGLIGSLLQPIFSGIPLVLMSPRYFLERPLRWLQAIARHHGTISGAPDFAYRLCAERIRDEALTSLDLSSWRLAFSGSEPVRHATLTAFVARFTAAGFSAEALYPCYGLAEATLFVAGGRRGAGMVSTVFAGELLGMARVSAAPVIAEGTRLVGCGALQPGHAIAIVDPLSGQRLADDRIGEIQVSGPSIAQGYWQRPEANAQTFRTEGETRWLRTGDLGFIYDGQLYIAGRCKDLIIVRGKNLYPQDLEQAVETHCEFARKGRVIAFSAEIDGIEGPALALEIAPMMKQRHAAADLVEQLRRCIFDACGEVPVAVVLLNPGTLPKTSSGKLQRAATRQGWKNHTLAAYALWQQGHLWQQGQLQTDTGLPASRSGASNPIALEGLEAELAVLWREVLGFEVTTRDAHFFTGGGNSLSAARLAARIGERWRRRFEIGQVFEFPSLARMAAAIEYLLETTQQTASAAEPLECSSDIAVSHAQQRQLFAWQLSPDSRAYHVATGIRLHGRLDFAALRRSFDTLVERHAVLRTSFIEASDVYLPHIHPAVPQTWMQADLWDGPQALPDQDARENALGLQARRFADQPFDLIRGPVLRLGLVRYGEEQHLLLLVLHHIATDGWSMQIMVDEFAAQYRALVTGTALGIAPPPLAYTDYALWQRRWLRSDEARRQLDYWRRELGGEVAPLALPFDHPPAAEHNLAAARMPFSLSPSLARRVRQLAGKHDATPFMVLLAAWHAWLYRVTGQTEIRTGVPVANRQRPETHGVVGFFTNTIVVRSVCAASMTTAALLSAVRRAALEGQMHQALPFDVVVEALNPARSAQHMPLFETSFNYLSDDYPALEHLPELTASRYEITESHAKVPLAIDLRESKDGAIAASLNYASALFDSASAVRMTAQYLRVVEAFVAEVEVQDPPAARTLAELDLIAAQERIRINAVSRAQVTCTGFQPFQARFMAHTVSRPEAPALVDGVLCLSYAELDRRAQQVALWLLEQGLCAGQPVAIVAERSAAFVIAMLGILKAGGAYVPLDAGNPHSRLTQALSDCGARLVLTQDAYPAFELEGVRQTTIAAAEIQGGPARALPEIDPRQMAYVIYTSGSSGMPKGVMISQAALANYVEAVLIRLGLPPGASYAMVSTVAADLGHTVLFGALAGGGTLHLIDRETTLDADRFGTYLAAHRVEVLKIVPAHLHALLQAQQAANVLPSHTLILGGEATAWPLLEQIRGLKPSCRVFNHYGPTETTVGILTQDAAQADHGAATLPLGMPLHNTCTWVLDAHLNAVGAGEIGELYLGGAGVARGYLNRPAMTAERFVPDPFTPGARLYRSGDRARRLADGTIEYLGRVDDQIKIRGFRVEPGEIAARMRGLAGVLEAAVIVGKAGRLAGFVTPQPDCVLDGASLRTALAALLPDYMVPATVTVLAALPLTRNGKLDRQALRELIGAAAPVTSPSGSSGSLVTAQGATEISLAGIWAEVLGLSGNGNASQIGGDDNFFALGGHSLGAMRVLSRVRAAWAIDLPLRTVFGAPTLHALAAQIDTLRGIGDTPNLATPVRAVARLPQMPLSLMQQRIWIVDQLAGGGLSSYNMAAGLDLSGELDVALLRASIALLVARHEVLRTAIGEHDGEPYLTCVDRLEVPLPMVACVALDPQRRAHTVMSMLAQAAQAPFDLAQPPLLRMQLLRFDARHHVLIVVLHHIIADGASVHILLDELCHIYRALGAGMPPALPALALQYADYAAWQREQLTPAMIRREQDFWRTYLAGAPHFLGLPADGPRPAVATHEGGALYFRLSGATAARVRTLANAHGMTPFAVLLASFQLFLHRLTQQADLVIGTDVAGRDRIEFEGLIGFFVNVLPLRSRMTADGAMLNSFDAWLRATQQTNWEALEHRALPFDRIVDALPVSRRRDANPLLQLLFVLRDLPRRNTSVPDLALELLRPQTTQSKFDMALFVEPAADGYEIEWVYASALFLPSTIKQWFEQWRDLLDVVLVNPAAPLDAASAELQS